MLNTIINQYQSKPNFTHQIKTTNHPPFYCLPAHTTQTLLINYTEFGSFVSRYYYTSSLNPNEFQFSTDTPTTITNSETGEILGEIYGFNNPDFLPFIEKLISSGTKFSITTEYGNTPAQLRHGQYKKLKSGKWKKLRA